MRRKHIPLLYAGMYAQSIMAARLDLCPSGQMDKVKCLSSKTKANQLLAERCWWVEFGQL